MKMTTIAIALVVGAATGWAARGERPTNVLDDTGEIVVQHPQQNPYGIGSAKTRIKLYGAGDEDFGVMPENATNATLWIVTINGTNYRGVAQDEAATATRPVCTLACGR